MRSVTSLVLLSLSLFLTFNIAGQDDTIDLDIDTPVAKALADPPAREALENACIATIGSDAPWHEMYRAVKILSAIGTQKSVAPLASLLDKEDTAHLARIALEVMPFGEVDQIFVEAIETAPRTVKLGLIASMAARKDNAAVSVLGAMTQTTDKQLLEHVTRALVKIGGEDAENTLGQLLHSGDIHVEAMAAVAALALTDGLVKDGKDAKAADYYQRFLDTKWPDHIRTGALKGLLRALPEQAPEVLIQAIKSKDVLLSDTAIAAVATLPGEGVSARVVSEFAALPPETQVPVMESLSRREEPLDPAFLYALLKDEREAMRIAVLKAVAEHGDSSSVAPIGQVLAASDSRDETLAAIETLRRLKGTTIDDTLVQFMTTSPPEERPDLIDALVQRRSDGLVEVLLAQVAETPARAAAFRGLEQLAGAEHLDTLLNALLSLQGDAGRSEAEAAVIAVLRNTGLTQGELVINKAMYGAVPNGEFKNVTRTVRETIGGGALSLKVSNALFGDPAPGQVKQLNVEYTVNGAPLKQTVPEGGTLNIVSQVIPPELIAKLAEPLNTDISDEARASLFRMLSRLGGKDAYAAVKGYLNSATPAIRNAAIRAVASWPDTLAVADLTDLFVASEDSVHRGLALRGCVRLLRQNALTPEDTLSVYRRLLTSATAADERKLVLSGLAEVNAPEAVAVAYPLLADEDVKEEAALALEGIKTHIGAEAYDKAVAELDANPASASEQKATFVPIFNGTDLQSWSGDPALWRVEEGVIVGETQAEPKLEHNTFLVWEGGQPADFTIKFLYKLESEWANSGLQFRSELFEPYRVRGYQADIAQEDWITGICYEEGGRGIVARRGQKTVFDADGKAETTSFAEENALKDYIYPDKWNEYEVHVKGNRFYSRINGHKMHEVIDDSPQARKSGVLAFQLHAGPPMKIHIKDILLKSDNAAE